RHTRFSRDWSSDVCSSDLLTELTNKLMIKKLLPFEKISYRSALSKDDLIIRLKNQIGVKKPVKFSSYDQNSDKSYIGIVRETSFEIQRAINYRNSFLPQINGNITNGMNGSKIDIEMQMLPLVKIFLIVWFSFVTLFSITTFLPFLQNDTD